MRFRVMAALYKNSDSWVRYCIEKGDAIGAGVVASG